MQDLFALCLLGTTVAVGLALQCEICGIGGTCNGVMRTCSSKHDKCSITLLRKSTGKNVQGFMKNCINSTLCNVGLSVINMGTAGLILSNHICCEENECKKTTPTMPWRNVTHNGKVCPACFSLEKSCNENHVYCVGDEIYCLEGTVAGISQTGGGTLGLNVILKGCATESACKEFHADSILLPWATKESQYNCAIAPEKHSILPPSRFNYEAARKPQESPDNSVAGATISEFFGNFLLIMAMKFFL
ncbi:phospholipase A2 inhibitor and Ly6/PLAUR domain-containing protein-like isoform X2 [Sceloporus undulatus]|uniref:phospholipase A2 inhibitor and Ly6/PLAUR domain-containing protein-like isoform X2 n=1 Tax=Sceloporus undulatus TaxID=8520 RepID=UPI001C4C4915|nr:phospholipase A2 inhibitor and Ly6/PLAUR domain-containing protein-like isoform X2 [Sceloporus undulatus]